MSASEAEEQESGPQSVEERLGESLVPLTQLGVTDPASTTEPSSFNSIAYLYLPPTPRPLLPSVRERSPAASDNECNVECDERQLHLAQTQLRLENRQLRLACLYVLYNQLRLDRQLHLAM